MKSWGEDKGDDILCVDYPLTSDSIVLEIGGYVGVWASKIISRYDPHMFIFEPISEYHSCLLKKFSSNPKVQIKKFGISTQNTMVDIYKNNDGSSLHAKVGTKEYVQLRNIEDILLEVGHEIIDLVQINIEGEEYPLLEYMIDRGLISKFRFIQVQFHTLGDDFEERRLSIQSKLSLTHQLRYNYPFIWESWQAK